MKITTNTNSLGWRLFLVSAAIVAVPALVGCQNRGAQQQPELTYGDRFPSPDEPRHVQRVLDAQAAAGARKDATLRVCHFDTGGGNPGLLNSLGEDKLDLMLLSDASLPLVLSLDVPKDDTYSAREQSIRTFLKDRGLTDAQVRLVAGPNARDIHAVAPLLKRAEAIETTPTAGSTPNGGASNGGMTAK
jgi:hypothetical protein